MSNGNANKKKISTNKIGEKVEIDIILPICKSPFLMVDDWLITKEFKKLSSTAKLIYAFLKRTCQNKDKSPDWYCYPSHQTIADHFFISRYQVIKHIQSLVDYKLLARVRTPRNNKYYFLWHQNMADQRRKLPVNKIENELEEKRSDVNYSQHSDVNYSQLTYNVKECNVDEVSTTTPSISLIPSQPKHCLISQSDDILLEWFNEWWTMVPNKDAKKPAQVKFYKIAKDKDRSWFDKFCSTYNKYVDLTHRSSYRKFALPITWLNQERWEDELIGLRAEVESEEAKEKSKKSNENPIGRYVSDRCKCGNHIANIVSWRQEFKTIRVSVCTSCTKPYLTRGIEGLRVEPAR